VEELRQDLQPQGRLELMLVEKIAAAYWRLCRAAREESSIMRRSLDKLDEGELDRREKYEEEVRDGLVELKYGSAHTYSDLAIERGGPPALERQEANRQKVVRRLRKNPVGLVHFMRTLDQAEDEIQRTGAWSADMLERIEREFATEENALLDRVDAAAPRKSGGSSIRFSVEEKDIVLALVQAERTSLAEMQEAVEERGRAALNAQRQAIGLPSEEEVQHIQRYESMYERQLYQAINQLERLQRRRIGEPTLPPLTVEVTGSA
jgi:hypothetical protein